MAGAAPITADYMPTDEADLIRCLADPHWRLCSGRLYRIVGKEGPNGEPGAAMAFVPNPEQRRFLETFHTRNVILKARQLGFTTEVVIMWLDHALFTPDQHCGIICDTLVNAQNIFRSKVKYAYDNLPDAVRAAIPMTKCTETEIEFANGSIFRVSTSMRSGTINRLHVSEMGKIAAKFPQKAKEIVSGSFAAVPTSGVIVVESTSEGMGGRFYDLATQAQASSQTGRPLGLGDWRFHFFPWHSNAKYTINPRTVSISPVDHLYFHHIQNLQGVTLTMGQRAWYVVQRDQTFSGDAELMWREYPSTPDECWQASTEGTYYHTQLASARSQGRIGQYKHVTGVPVHTFWDIGAGDGTAIWLMQHIGSQERFIGFIEGWGEGYAYFIRQLQDKGYVYGRHFLPHDGDHERQQAHRVARPIDMLQELMPGASFEIVPRVEAIQDGIQLTRQRMSSACWDADECKEGLIHLTAYRKSFNSTTQTFNENPLHDVHSEAADALRQWAQGYDPAAQPGRQTMRRRGHQPGAMAR